MTTTLFVSDLHLEAGRPDIAAQFQEFLRGEARSADALYILGDLFESWVGDDDPNEHYAKVKSELRALTDSGVPTYFMHGNRDFMIGKRFARETGITLLDDPCVRDIHGQQVLLSHGDAYCTDDHQYQTVRKMTRDPKWQMMMLQKPLAERLAFAAQARTASLQRGGELNEEITDVNQDAIRTVMQQHDTQLMLHGHTHRPAVHEFAIDGVPVRRIVLGDWYDQGSVVRWTDSGPELAAMARDADQAAAGRPL